MDDLISPPTTWPLRHYQTTGAVWLANLPKGVRGRLLADPPGFGKALAIDTPIPTPNGWTAIEELVPGDRVFDEHGLPCNVVQVYRVETPAVAYRVVFSDGSTLTTNAEHEWLTWPYTARAALQHETPGKRDGITYGTKVVITKPQLLTTEQIRASLHRTDGGINHAIALTDALQCPHVDLPIPPYVLGVWLGDGHTLEGAISISIDKAKIVEEFRRYGYTLIERPHARKGKARTYRVPQLTAQLRQLGVWGNKHVPSIYLRASATQRADLLEGLMDTDGTVSKMGACCFDNTNKNLADAVADLVMGLGGKVTRAIKHPKITGRPQAVCADCYRVMFTPTFYVFRCPQKVARQNVKNRRPTQRWRYIVDVVEVPPTPMRCIAVDSPSHLYLAGREYIPTHNTRSALAAARTRLHYGTTDSGCILVVTTAISRFDWRREAARFWPELPSYIVSLDDPKSRRKGETEEAYHARREAGLIAAVKAPPDKPQLLIVGYESAYRVYDYLMNHDVVPGFAVIDESHVIKKETSEYSKTVKPIAAKSEQFALLTGTPIHNRCEDLHNLVNLCTVNRFGTKWTFAYKYFQIHTGLHGKSIGELLDKNGLHRDISDVCLARDIAEAYGELPARIRELKKVEAPSYRISREAARKLKDGGEVTKALRAAAKAKLDAGAEFVASLGEPVVVYTYERADAEAMVKRLTRLKVPCVLATGDVPSTTRDKRIEAWKHGEGVALVCTMDAVRESATLTRASAMVFIDLDWLPGKMLQCEGRIDPARQPEGERRPARYYYLVVDGGTDEVVAERVCEKIAQADGVVSKGGESARLGEFLKPLSHVKDVEARVVLEDLVARIEARAARFEAIGATFGELRD